MHEEAVAVARRYIAQIQPGIEEVLARGYREGGYQRAMMLAAETMAARKDTEQTTFINARKLLNFLLVLLLTGFLFSWTRILTSAEEAMPPLRA